MKKAARLTGRLLITSKAKPGETMRSVVLFILLAASTVAFAQTGLAPSPDPFFAPQPEHVPLVCSNSFGQVVPCDPAMPPPDELDLEPAPPPALTCMNVYGQVIPCPP
jgi:hypothetical protein